VQLGDGTNTNQNTLSADVLTSMAAITAGWYHTCALTDSGSLPCWGQNGNGQASAVHAYLVFLHAKLCLMLAAWRWYKHESKYTPAADVLTLDKRDATVIDCCFITDTMVTLNNIQVGTALQLCSIPADVCTTTDIMIGAAPFA
jgi:hypothetical protein